MEESVPGEILKGVGGGDDVYWFPKCLGKGYILFILLMLL